MVNRRLKGGLAGSCMFLGRLHLVCDLQVGKVSRCLALTEGRTAKRQICNSETVFIISVKTGKN